MVRQTAILESRLMPPRLTGIPIVSSADIAHPRGALGCRHKVSQNSSKSIVHTVPALISELTD